jgi:signal transduction histidine kinase
MLGGEIDQMPTKKNGEASMAHASHEIRNALACIFQFGNILLGGLTGQLSKEQSEYMSIILANASRIRAVLEEGTSLSSANVVDRTGSPVE